MIQFERKKMPEMKLVSIGEFVDQIAYLEDLEAETIVRNDPVTKLRGWYAGKYVSTSWYRNGDDGSTMLVARLDVHETHGTRYWVN